MTSPAFLSFAVFLLLASVSSAQYDFFYFVLQWPGSYCDTSSSCCYPTYGKPPTDFGIHGLWPNNNDGSYPSNCDSSYAFDESQIQDLLSSMQTNWPSLSCPSSDSSSFWSHEWSKHGTCSESVFNEHDYFQDALNLKGQVGILQCLNSAGITPNGGSYSLTSIKAAITACIGHTPYIECNKDVNSRYRLYQVYICVDYYGTALIDCPIYPTSGACPSSIYFPSF